MPEVRVIPTTTLLTVDPSSTVAQTFYNPEEPPNILSMVLADTIGANLGVSFIEGQLVAVVKNYPSEVDVQVSNKGDLIIIGDDAHKYSINADGELIYTP